MWTDPFWGLPYSSASEEKRWRRETLTVPQLALRFPPAKTREPLDLARPFLRRSPGHRMGAKDFGTSRQAVCKIRSYAHDRIVLSSYLESPRYKGKAVSLFNLRRGMFPPTDLELLRETRRGLKVGNRWRSEPLPTRFTANARNLVRDVAHISEHDHTGVGCFMTFTFPGGTSDGYFVASCASGYIVDRINRWLRYKVSGGVFSYVWELQERGAPHLHYLFRLPDGADRKAFTKLCKEQWYKILVDISEETQVDLFQRAKGGTWIGRFDVLQVDCQPIEGTYARYMSKYLSKKKSKGGLDHTWNPGRWWGVSAPGRRLAMMRRLEQVIEITTEEVGMEAIRHLAVMLQPISIGQKWFARVPEGHVDSISMQCGTGAAAPLAKRIAMFFLWGDSTELSDWLASSGSIVAAVELERKKLDEFSKRKQRQETDGKFVLAGGKRVARGA